MYIGIEISHPVYAMLTVNLILPAALTIVDFLLLVAVPFDLWYHQNLFLNSLCSLFHTTSWTIISVLRYVLIEHREWLDKQWSVITKLTPIMIVSQFLR